MNHEDKFEKVLFHGKTLSIGQADVFPEPYQQVQKVSYVYFDFDKPGYLEVICDKAYEDIVIRPRNHHIQPECDKQLIRIYIDKPINFSIELNGKKEEALMVFAGSRNKSDPTAFENVIYYGPGEYDVDCMQLTKDNTLVYLDAGAVVNGKIRGEGLSHVTIDGMGTLTMQKYSYYGPSIYLGGCKHVEIKNILIRDSCNFHCMIENCEDVHIDNIRGVSYRSNSDGIDICGSRHVVVENVFLRIWDDALCIKGLETGDIYDVLFQNCILWNDFARPIEMGVSLRADEVHDITYRDIDIIHSLTGYPLMGIHHGDRANVHDIHFENIRIEDIPSAQLFDLRIHTGSVYNKDNKKGKIHHFYFKNIELMDTGRGRLPMKSRIEGYSEDHDVSHIYFEDISLYGKKVHSIEELGMEIKDFVSDVYVSASEPGYNCILTKMTPKADFVWSDDGYYRGIISVTFENVGDQPFCDNVELEIYPAVRRVQRYIENIQVQPGETIVKEIPVVIGPGKTVFYLQSRNISLSTSHYYIDLSLNLHQNQKYIYPITDCFGHDMGKIGISYRNGEFLVLESKLLEEHTFVLYCADTVEEQDREIIFSVEETNLGLSPAIVKHHGKYELAPQIGCVEEITYVYKNQPKTDIRKFKIIKNSTGEIRIPLKNHKLLDKVEFLLELELDLTNIKIVKKFPMTVFGSQIPEESAHMFVKVKLFDK